MTIMGFTFDQWAIILKIYPAKERTFKGFAESRLKWVKAHDFNPGETEIIGVNYDHDYDSALELFTLSRPLGY